MKKILVFSLLLAILSCSACTRVSFPDTGVKIDVDASYDGAGELTYRESLSFRVDGPIRLNLFVNAYARPETVTAGEQERLAAYPSGFRPGGIVLSDVTLNGRPALLRLSEDRCCAQVLAPAADGERAVLSFSAVVTVPEARTRFGRWNGVASLAGCFVSLARSERRTVAFGDPFVTETADYTLRLSLPEELTAATGGVRVREQTENGRRLLTVRASCRRELAVCVLTAGQEKTEQRQGVTLRSYGADGALPGVRTMLDRLLSIAPFPYEELAIVRCGFYAGGMEYPGLILIGEDFFGDETVLSRIAAHETAHQYFYGAVGSDQILEPWVDESLVEFLCLESEKQFASEYRDRLAAYVSDAALRGERPRLAVGGSLYDYADTTEYVYAVYIHGCMMWRAVYDLIGEKAFADGLRRYYQENAFGLADGDRLIDAFSAAAGLDLRPIFASYLNA